jgi:hypothetical protein
VALQTGGAISLNNIHTEAGGGSGSQCSINDSDIRGLISKGSGVQMSISEWYGASAATWYGTNSSSFISYSGLSWRYKDGNWNTVEPSTGRLGNANYVQSVFYSGSAGIGIQFYGSYSIIYSIWFGDPYTGTVTFTNSTSAFTGSTGTWRNGSFLNNFSTSGGLLDGWSGKLTGLQI